MKARRHSFSPFLVTCTRLNKMLCQLVRPLVRPLVCPLVRPLVHPLVTSIFDSGFCCFKACRDLLFPLPNRTQLRQPCIRPCLSLDWVYCSQPPQNNSPSVNTLQLHMFLTILIIFMVFFNKKKITKIAYLGCFSAVVGTKMPYLSRFSAYQAHVRHRLRVQ